MQNEDEAKATQRQSKGKAKAKHRQSNSKEQTVETKLAQSKGTAKAKPRSTKVAQDEIPKQLKQNILHHHGPSWSHLGTFLGYLWPYWSILGLCTNNAGAILAHLGLTHILGPSWDLGAFFGPAQGCLGLFGVILGTHWDQELFGNMGLDFNVPQATGSRF